MFFFNDTATTEIYTLSLHDALPIYEVDGLHPQLGQRHRPLHREPGDRELGARRRLGAHPAAHGGGVAQQRPQPDRKSTRLNSSHANISYAVFCLKKKK